VFGSVDIVKLLIAAGAKANVADVQGVKIIDKAKKLEREAIVKLLEAAGATATSPDPAPETAAGGSPAPETKTEDPNKPPVETPTEPKK
jgi:hypothetical protein